MRDIKTLLQEAEFYQSQGLLQDALKKYITASKTLIQHPQGKKKQKLIQSISKKIHILENAIYHNKDGEIKPELTKTSQDLVKKLFSYSQDLEKDEAAFEGAKLLARLGQYERAVQEFDELIKNKKFCVIAAKNIVRCHISNSTSELVVEHFKKWMDNQIFEGEQIEKIRFFIETHFKRHHISHSLPVIKKQPAVEITENHSKETEESLDIISIVIVSDHQRLTGKDLELEVNFQNADNINVIIPNDQKEYIQRYQSGDLIQKIQFFSTEAFFMGPVRILSITQIDSGPRKGDYSMDIKMMD